MPSSRSWRISYPLDKAQLQDYITTVNKWGDELPAILNAIDRGDGETAGQPDQE